MAFGVYVHIPYCIKKCPYCDFNSHGVGDDFPENKYTQSLLKEVELSSGYYNETLSTIFIGGGTPSLFGIKNIEEIINSILKNFSCSSDLEITLELNPKTVTLEKLKGFKSIGINRLSAGIQSFKQSKLNFLGRLNTPEDGRAVLNDIYKAGFSNFNFDLICGCSNETMEDWRLELEEAKNFNNSHVSVYCLTIETGTDFARLYKKGALRLPSDEIIGEILNYTGEYLNDLGFEQYEISNFAREGYESKHNLLYWENKDYLGFGAGAHSHISKTNGADWGSRWSNIKNPESYMNMVYRNKPPVISRHNLNRIEALEEKVLMGLRLNRGINLEYVEKSFDVKLNLENIDYLLHDDYLKFLNTNLSVTDRGRLFTNEIILRVLDSFV